MKRLPILIIGLLACAVAYGSVYFACTKHARTLRKEISPEVAWLKHEFDITDAEFKRISDLHAAYLPQCKEMCAKIDRENTRLSALLSNSTNVTKEIEQTLDSTARLRAECQTMMLNHFFEVSKAMSPDQGKRYLAWVQEKTINPHSMSHAGMHGRWHWK